jgi:hypothetical protein
MQVRDGLVSSKQPATSNTVKQSVSDFRDGSSGTDLLSITTAPQAIQDTLLDLTKTPSHNLSGASNHEVLTVSLPAAEISPASPKVTVDDASEPRHQNISMSLPITLFEQDPRSRQHISLGAVKEIVSQDHLDLPTFQGLYFAGANAIIYGCITIAASRFTLINLSEEVRTLSLTSDIGVALLLGLALIGVVQVYASGWLRYGAGALLWTVGGI